MKSIEKEYGVKIVYSDCIDGKGYYVPAYRIIVINNGLPESEQTKVLLHELGHVPQTDYAGLYNCSKPSHYKMEAEATEYMLKEEVETYLMENDLYCKSINPVVFLENRHLSLRYAPVVEKILSEI